LRLEDSKEGESIRPIGLPVVEYLEGRRANDVGTYVFPAQGEDNAFGSFPNHWKHIFEDSPLADVTPHVLRHSFASIANDLGFTEVTIAALVGHEGFGDEQIHPYARRGSHHVGCFRNSLASAARWGRRRWRRRAEAVGAALGTTRRTRSVEVGHLAR